MKRSVFLSFLLFTTTISVIAQSNKVTTLATQSDSSKMSSIKIDSSNNIQYHQPLFIRSIDGHTPLYVIDGVISNHGTVGLGPNNIQSISVIKGIKATDLYGERGKDGVILITTKLSTLPDQIKVSPAKTDFFGSMTIIKSDTSKISLNSKKPFVITGREGRQPLYVIDGVISNHGTIGLDPNDIQSISVIKGIKATDLYGEKGKDGVILIITKKKTI